MREQYISTQEYELTPNERETWALGKNTTWRALTEKTFPQRATLVLSGSETQIFDKDTNSLWIKFKNGGNIKDGLSILDSSAATNTAMYMQNGILYIGSDLGGLKIINFRDDSVLSYHKSKASGGKFKFGIGQNNKNKLLTGSPFKLFSEKIISIEPITNKNDKLISVITSKGVHFLKDHKVLKEFPVEGNIIKATHHKNRLFILLKNKNRLIVHDIDLKSFFSSNHISPSAMEIHSLPPTVNEAIIGFTAKGPKLFLITKKSVNIFSLNDFSLQKIEYGELIHGSYFFLYDHYKDEAILINKNKIYSLPMPFNQSTIIKTGKNIITIHNIFLFSLIILSLLIICLVYCGLNHLWKKRHDLKSILFFIWIIIFEIVIVVFIIPELLFYAFHNNWYHNISRLETFQTISPDYNFQPGKKHGDGILKEYAGPQYIRHEITKLSFNPSHKNSFTANNGIDTILNLKPNFQKSVFYLMAKTRTEIGSAFLKIQFKGREYLSPPSSPTPSTNYLCLVLPEIITGPIELTASLINTEGKSVVLDIFALEKKYIHPPSWESPLKMFREPINHKKNNRLRIVVLGGSTTYSDGEPERQNNFSTWPALLEARLEASYPGRYEVINLGIGGAETGLMNEFYHRIYNTDFGYKNLLPDIVLIATVWNDIGIALDKNLVDKNIFGNISYSQLLDYIRYSSFLKGFAIKHYIYSTLYHVKQRVTDEEQSGIIQLAPKLWMDIRRSNIESRNIFLNSYAKSSYLPIVKNGFATRLNMLLDNFNSAQHKPHIAFISFPGVWFPNDSHDEKIFIYNSIPRYQAMSKNQTATAIEFNSQFYNLIHEQQKEVVMQVANQRKIPFIDISHEISQWDIKDRVKLFHSEDIHMSIWGYNVIADRVFNAITENAPAVFIDHETKPAL